MKRFFNFILIFILILFLSSCKNNIENVSSIENDIPIGISFPPIGTVEHLEFGVKHLNTLNIKKIKLEVNWNLIEKEEGVYSWKNLDYRINYFNEHNIEIFLMVSVLLPDVYSNDDMKEITTNQTQQFSNFITALITRYGDNITKFQFGNEWDSENIGYHEDINEFIKLNNVVYTITKSINPDIDIVLGGITRAYPLYILLNNGIEIESSTRHLINFEEHKTKFMNDMSERIINGLEEDILNVFNNALYDIVDIHLYDDVELFSDIISYVEGITDKPILVSELGAPNPRYEVYTEEYHLERMKLALITLSKLDILEIYHFSLVDHDAYHANNGLLDSQGHEKLVYYLYKNMIKTDDLLPSN